MYQVSLRKAYHTSKATPGGQGHSEKADRYEQTERGGDQLVPWNIVLEVSVDASVGEIRAAYHKRISEYHPDKVASLGKEIRKIAERKSKEINVAYSFAMEQRRKR
ncbi:MAG: J domain-containing protein [Beijerinckiaceae bacterium]